MKTGMNLLLWTTHVTEEHFPLFANLKQTGFDGVEIPLFDGDAAHYKTIARGARRTTASAAPPSPASTRTPTRSAPTPASARRPSTGSSGRSR